MAEAYICDFTRSPIGRYAGALKDVRTDDLAAHPIRALGRTQRRHRLGGAGRLHHGLRQPGRRGQPQRRPHGRAAGRPADRGLRLHDQPPLRVGAGRGRHRRPRDQVRRRASDAGRRGRKHDPRAVRHGQGDRGVLPLRRGLRHHHRLALRQQADAEGLRHRLDAGNRRERRRGIPDLPRRPGQVRLQQPAAREEGAGQRLLRQGNHAGHHQGPQGRHRGRA